MALTLSHTLDSGVTGDYWRITKMEIDYPTNSVQTFVGLYLSSEARHDAKQPLTVRFEQIFLDPGALASGTDPRVAVYDALKALPFFEGAQDN
jgi:hypothetical protein